ncbi:MAG: 4-hydroxythreonine-4-phosphate dehydrogenase PdxA [Synechococcaceae bacterium WB9_4xC_028]|nr:4-hydroxythreonine-4-phosphate dehydrogenase PdxA [Synechococcaceae bacterium WB9_4xC_028]
MTIESSDANQTLLIALGDPAGIGMEVTLKALASPALPSDLNPLLVGCRRALEATYQQLRANAAGPLADPDGLPMLDQPLSHKIEAGDPCAISGDSSFQWLTTATKAVLQGQGRALVTAPIAKHAWHAAGHHYPGQTERLAELCGTDQASMLFTAVSPLTGWRLNTLLATTHIPLAAVPEQLTPARILHKLNTLAAFCQRFNPSPRLLVAGLNPHAGEQGQLGDEEQRWLAPLLQEWSQDHPEVSLSGPLPPDTCWLSAARSWQQGAYTDSPDGILALYHDQGLIPVKLLAFDQAVNTTLGLPFLRTSPDHGTGFDIAGRGVARADSMVAALQAAWELSSTSRA